MLPLRFQDALLKCLRRSFGFDDVFDWLQMRARASERLRFVFVNVRPNDTFLELLTLRLRRESSDRRRPSRWRCLPAIRRLSFRSAPSKLEDSSAFT